MKIAAATFPYGKMALIVIAITLFSHLSNGQANIENGKLTSLSQFKSTSANWFQASAVSGSPSSNSLVATKAKEGNIIVNINTPTEKEHLVTSFDHNDIDLSFDFMMPKGSNSGVYLMARYEVQLYDSWTKLHPTFADCGGIYQRWRGISVPESEDGYEGKPPLSNPALAPGLWQNLKIEFRGPKFDAAGNKIKNARFERVFLNDILIQQGIEVSGPTRGSLLNDEKPSGPIFIQGDHGPVAFRNITYKAYQYDKLALKNLHYSRWVGKFAKFPPLDSLKQEINNQPCSDINSQLAETNDNFALKFTADIVIPQDGIYSFDAAAYGGVKLTVASKVLIDDSNLSNWVRTKGPITLKAGTYPFELLYYKSQLKRSAQLAIGVDGSGLQHYDFQGMTSTFISELWSPIVLKPNGKVIIQRGFLEEKSTTYPYFIFVGTPQNFHYAYDAAAGNIASIWRGAFLDVTGMWYHRGLQTNLLLGAAYSLHKKPLIATLTDVDNSQWPDTLLPAHNYSFKGYNITPSQIPIFKSNLLGLTIEDYTEASLDAKSLNRTITLKGNLDGKYILLAEESDITKTSENQYILADRQYYLDVPNNKEMPLTLRTNKGKQQLLLKLPKGKTEAKVVLNYTR